MTDSSLIDRIVNGVLDQLGRGGTAPSVSTAPVRSAPKASMAPASETRSASLAVSEMVITADLLAERLNGARVISVSAKAIVTPAARDYLKEQGIELRRCDASKAKPAPAAGNASAEKGTAPAKSGIAPLLIVVKHTEAVASLWEHLQPTWSRELVACPDDAAKLAIGELSRAGASQVVILAEQTFRAACLANRHERVKAVPIESLLDIKTARKQIRVNTWCVDPTDRSWFELRNLFKAFTANS